jgi:beta-glucanase (GH16 family)
MKLNWSPMLCRLRLFLLMAANAVMFCTIASQGAFASPPTGYNWVWSDEFNGAIGSYPNSANWTYDTGLGWGGGDGELESYTTTNATIQADSAATDGKVLQIQSTHSGSNYYSSRILSQGLQSFQYGYIEMRAKLSSGGPGLWPAFWLLGTDEPTDPWPGCGEVDIMENWGNNPDFCQGTAIGPNGSGGIYNPNAQSSSTTFSSAYHTYGLLWTANELQYMIDNTVYFTATPSIVPSGGSWPFNNPFFILLNQAVGGNNDPPTSQTVFPANYDIDYVRVFQAKSNLLQNPTFSTGNLNSWTVWSPNGTGSAAFAQSSSYAFLGNYYGTEWSTSAYNVDISQTPTSVPNGTYTLSAWVMGSGGQSSATMYAKRFENTSGSDAISVNIPTTGATNAWTLITIPGIVVSTGEVECGFYSIASANQWINIGEATLTPS